ncbi:hypothetical protein KY285_000251 [Solanum tuberosum]|nr:hypothetical protein KY284_000288 [Solanum tuberosum]KAH0729075.1 hypothetical protein KY289_000263 [Solanum tuberosum]KAH0764380.1 hypothetical protein KY285_000251 [Solanum tuberosum]
MLTTIVTDGLYGKVNTTVSMNGDGPPGGVCANGRGGDSDDGVGSGSADCSHANSS